MAAIAIVAASVIPSVNAIIKRGIAGATITQGQPVYLDAADSYKVKLADSDGSQAISTVVGISTTSASAGQYVEYCESDPSFTPGSTQLAGDDVWLFDAAGGLTITKADLEAGDYVVHLGTYLTTTTMNLKITIGGVIAA